MKTALLRTALLLLALSSLVTLSSCGGGGGGPASGASGTSGGGTTGSGGATTPNSILSGKYAFSFSGTVTNSRSPIGPSIVLAGSFTADGAGNITSGIEDINQPLETETDGIAISGNYSIGTDGRGTLNITGSGNLNQTFKIAVENGNHGQLIRFDSGASGSGTFDLQTASAFSLNSLNGKFVYEWNGVDSMNNVFSRIGQVNLASGSASGAGDLNAGGGYSQETFSGFLEAPDGNGHGFASFFYNNSRVPLTYSYDIISANRILLMEIDTAGAAIGEADLQSATFTASSLSGPYTFSLGQPLLGFGLIGQIVTDGQGNISSSDTQENNFGALAAGPFIGTPTYALANTVQGVTVNGRFTMSATEPSNFLDNFVVYLVSPSQAFVMETDSDQLTFGQLVTQTGGPYSSSSLNGNYGLNVTGIDGKGVEVDAVGQFNSSGTSTLSSGTLDISYQGGNTTPTFPNSAFSSASYSVINNTTGHGTLNFTAAGAAFQYAFYFVSPSQAFMLQIDDQSFVTIGSALSQPPIP